MKSTNQRPSTSKTLGRRTLLGLAIGGAAVAAVTAGQLARRGAEIEKRFPPEGQFVDVDGVKIHAVVAGSGPDLVLIHGASGSTRDMTFDLLGRLTDRYRVIVFDRPGLGYSDVSKPEYADAFSTAHASPYEQADILAKAAAHLGAQKPIVVGHSFGGIVALAWALNHDPAAVVSLAGVSNPWEGGLGALYAINSSSLGGGLFVPLLSAFAPQSKIDSTIEGIFRPQPAPEGYADYVGAELVVRPTAMRANARQVNFLLPHVQEMQQRYSELTLPIEIVHGDADTIVPIHVHAEPFVSQVASANLTVLSGVGHMPHHVDASACIDAINRAATRAGLL